MITVIDYRSCLDKWNKDNTPHGTQGGKEYKTKYCGQEWGRRAVISW